MEANELRIGNFVTGLQLGDTIITTVKNFYEYGITNHNGFRCDYEYIHPIPLTEEWLLKFGFKEGSANITMGYTITSYLHPSGVYLTYHTHNGMGYESNGDNDIRYGLKRLKYVHQLQNLFFALESNELYLNN